MATLEEMKANLYSLNYPGINVMDDESIANVFGSANRLNFLTWVYSQLQMDEPLPSQMQAKCSELADTIYEHGFCSSLEKLSFVKGDGSLSPLQEIQICQRIFKLLNVLKSNQENTPVLKPAMTLEDLESFRNQDLNLFPELGIMKTRSEKERRQEIEKYKRKIALLQEEVSKAESAEGSNIDYDTSAKTVNDAILTELENDAIKFKENMENLSSARESKNKQFKFNNLATVVGNCDKALGKLDQYFKNAEVMEKFEENLSTSSSSNKNNFDGKLIEKFWKMSSEVILEYE